MTGRRICEDCNNLVRGAQAAGPIGGSEGQEVGNAIAIGGWFRAAKSLRRDAEERGRLEGRAANRRRRRSKRIDPAPVEHDQDG